MSSAKVWKLDEKRDLIARNIYTMARDCDGCFILLPKNGTEHENIENADLLMKDLQRLAERLDDQDLGSPKGKKAFDAAFWEVWNKWNLSETKNYSSHLNSRQGSEFPQSYTSTVAIAKKAQKSKKSWGVEKVSKKKQKKTTSTTTTAKTPKTKKVPVAKKGNPFAASLLLLDKLKNTKVPDPSSKKKRKPNMIALPQSTINVLQNMENRIKSMSVFLGAMKVPSFAQASYAKQIHVHIAKTTPKTAEKQYKKLLNCWKDIQGLAKNTNKANKFLYEIEDELKTSKDGQKILKLIVDYNEHCLACQVGVKSKQH